MTQEKHKFKVGDKVTRERGYGIILIGEIVEIIQVTDDGRYYVIDPYDGEEMSIDCEDYTLADIYFSPLYKALL